MDFKSSLTVFIVCFIGYFLYGEESPIPKGRKVAIFYDNTFPAGAPAKPAQWYKDVLVKNSNNGTLINASEISDASFLTKSNFDFLILPDGQDIPVDAEYSIPNFLAQGGNIISQNIPKNSFAYNATSKKWEKFSAPAEYDKALVELQIRQLPWKWAVRSLKTKLTRNNQLSNAISSLLPETVAPIDKTYGILDKMNLYQSTHAREGDLEVNATNYETAANIIFPLYLLPDGEPTDFVLYRYHNRYFNGPSLVLLGQVGAEIIKADMGGAFRAILDICESRLPGELEAKCYEKTIQLQEKFSKLAMEFTKTIKQLQDAALIAFYENHNEIYWDMKDRISALDKKMAVIKDEKQATDALWDGQNANQANLYKKTCGLIDAIDKTDIDIQAIHGEIAKLPSQPKPPANVKIASSLKEFAVEAGMTSPFTRYILRKDYFNTMRELGVNVIYPQTMDHILHKHLQDPIIRKQMEDFQVDLYCYWDNGLYKILPKQGKLELGSGAIKETSEATYKYDVLEKEISNFVARWQDVPKLRYHHIIETVLQLMYWGKQAKAEYTNHLNGKYKDITSLNAQWGSNYIGFEEISLPTHKPSSIAEHGNWEDWIKFREDRYYSAQQFWYDKLKKYDPTTPVAMGCSSSSIWCPMYAANFYRSTQIADMNGGDGTGGVPATNEWIWFDLNCGKPVLTCEWGVFYFPPANPLLGRQSLIEEAWTIVSGGSVGVNLWTWRYSGFGGNFVDMTGLPTIYGGELKQLVSEFKKIDHIILDGKRKKPEVRILYSNTCRCHDQTWGKWGEISKSPHLNGVNNLYRFCQKQHLTCRVVAEEAFSHGQPLEDCRLLVIPQAEYLSGELQRKIMDWVKAGGNVLLDGKVGRYDNYGHAADLFFMEAEVVPSPAENRRIDIAPEGIFELSADADIFSPLVYGQKNEAGKILVKYGDGRPALVGTRCDKGMIFISGLNLSAIGSKEEALASSVIDRIFNDISHSRKYECTDTSVIMRDWEYQGEDYLFVVNPKGRKRFCEASIKVKDSYGVSDYLVGASVPSAYDGKYTTFSALIPSPGARVYHLHKESRNTQVRQESPPKSAKSVTDEASAAATERQSATGTLFSGMIWEEGGMQAQKEIGGYLFQVSLVGSDAFITIRKDSANNRRKIEPGKDYVVRFKDKSFFIKCCSIHSEFPKGVEVQIQEGKAGSQKHDCSITQQDSSLIIGNDLVRLRIAADKGARIEECVTLVDDINHLHDPGMEIYDKRGFGDFYDKEFTWEIARQTPDEASLMFTSKGLVKGQQMKKTLTLKKGHARIDLKTELLNTGSDLLPLSLRLHPEMNIGGAADGDDVFFIPTVDGFKNIGYAPGRVEWIVPKKNWLGCCDQLAQIAYVTKFDMDEVEKAYVWMGGDCYTLELFGFEKTLKPKQNLILDCSFYLIKGVSGISSFNQGVLSYVKLPSAVIDQCQSNDMVVEIGSDSMEKRKVKGELAIHQNGKMIKQIAVLEGDVKWDDCLAKKIQMDVADLEDGKYDIVLSVTNGNGENILKDTQIFCASGKAKKKALDNYQRLNQQFQSIREKKSINKEKLFEIFKRLEELHMTINGNDMIAAEKMIDELDKFYKSSL